jgi:hypothetical protein
MKMHDNIPANWRTCMGALQTRARAKKDPQEGQKRPRDTSTACADISSKTKRTRCGDCTCKPLRLGHIYPPPMLVAGGRARSRITHPQRLLSRNISRSKCTHKLSRINARERCAIDRELVTSHAGGAGSKHASLDGSRRTTAALNRGAQLPRSSRRTNPAHPPGAPSRRTLPAHPPGARSMAETQRTCLRAAKIPLLRPAAPLAPPSTAWTKNPVATGIFNENLIRSDPKRPVVLLPAPIAGS